MSVFSKEKLPEGENYGRERRVIQNDVEKLLRIL